MEYYSKCNVCGKIICYTDKDLKDNAKNSLIAGLAAMSSIGNAVAGTRYDMYESGKLSSRASDKVVDYSKCSNCGSKDITLVTKKFAIFSNRNNGNYSVKDLLSEAKKYLEKKDYEDAFCFATMILNEEDDNYDAYLIRFLASYEINRIQDLGNLKEDYYNNQHFQNLIRNSNSEQKEKLLKQYNINKEKRIVSTVEELLKCNKDEKLLEEIDYTIKEIKENNLENKISIQRLNEKKIETLYFLGCENLEENTVSSITKAINYFESTKNYKDSSKKIDICNSMLSKLKNKSRKKIVIFSIAALICVLMIVVYNSVKEPIQLSKVKKLIDDKEYKEAYDNLINIKESKTKSDYLSMIHEHGRYVIKNIEGTNENTIINYEYDKNGNPKTITKTFIHTNRDYEKTNFKYEYIFEYEYLDEKIIKMTITTNEYVRDMEKIYITTKDEYSFYDNNFNYEFTINTSYDHPKYNNSRIPTLIEYIYFNNIKSIKHTSNSGKNVVADEFNNKGLTKDSIINKHNKKTMEFKSDNWDWSDDLVMLTFDDYGLIIECKDIDNDEVDYTFTRKYKNGLLINKVKDEDMEIYNYEYDSHNNFIRIRKEDNENLIGSANDTREIEWEWIDY